MKSKILGLSPMKAGIAALIAIGLLGGQVAEAVPIAVPTATPNPALVNELIQLDGTGSYDTDPTLSIDSWEWDTDNDGFFDDSSGPFSFLSFPSVGDYILGLRVTNNKGDQEAGTTSFTISVRNPSTVPEPGSFALLGLGLAGLGLSRRRKAN